MPRGLRLPSWIVGATLVCVALALAAAGAKEASGAPSGAVRVSVSSLPAGQPARVVLSRSGQRPRVVSAQRKTVRGLAPGRWRVAVLPVAARRQTGAVRTGARISPLRSRLSVRVRRGRVVPLRVAYGTIINPRVSRAPRVLGVSGAPGRPSAVRVPRSSSARVGDYVVSGPTDALPYGLIARVSSASNAAGARQLSLQHVPVSDVAPVISYSGPLVGVREVPRIQAFGGDADLSLFGSSCGLTGGSRLSGGFDLGSPRVEADFNASLFGGGPRADLIIRARPSFSFSYLAAAGFFCEKEVAAAAVVGVIPAPVPIPVYAAVPLKIRAQSTASASIETTVSWDLAVGMRTRRSGVLLAARPVFEASNPSASIDVSTDSETKIGPSLGFEVGVGVRSALSVNLEVESAVEFSARPDECSWDWRLGGFTVKGSAGPLSINTPPAGEVNHRIWTGCGGSTFGRAPNAIRSVDFLNRDYTILCPPGDRVTAIQVRNGRWSSATSDPPGDFPTIQPIISYGDATGDGREDAALYTDCSAGGSGSVPNTLVFEMGADGQARQVGGVVFGRRPTLSGGVLTTRLFIRGASDPAGSPSIEQIDQWRFQNGDWAKFSSVRQPYSGPDV